MPTARRPLTLVLAASTLAFGLAACGGDDGAASPPAPTGEADVLLSGNDTLKYDVTEVTASAGEIVVQLTNEGAVPHNVLIEEPGDVLVVETGGGQTAQGSIELDAGTYTFYCDIVGHREAGMVGTLTVE